MQNHLEAASTTFTRNGYLGTSMAEIAALAAVSKQTVDKHLADKKSRFTAVVIGTISEISEPIYL